MGKHELLLEKLQDELLELIPAEHKGKALDLLKECDKTSKRAIASDIMKGYKSAVNYIKLRNNL